MSIYIAHLVTKTSSTLVTLVASLHCDRFIHTRWLDGVVRASDLWSTGR